MVAERSGRIAWAPIRVALWAGIIGTLLLPLLAMQITDEVNWTGFDFLAAAALLVGAGASFELLLRSKLSFRLRAIIAVAIATAVATLWAEGAVGVF